MNNDQHNGALKFSLAGLLACGAIAAYFMSPAVHQAVANSLSYVLLVALLAAYGRIAYQAKQHKANGLLVAGALLVDAALACAATAAAINIGIDPSYRHFDIMTSDMWNLTGDSTFSRLQLDTLLGMLTVAASIRALIPGRLYGGRTDTWFIVRWLMLGLAMVPAVTHLNVNFDSLPNRFWLTSLIAAGSAGLFFTAIQVIALPDWWKTSADTDDQHIRGSRLVTASALADAIRLRLKK